MRAKHEMGQVMADLKTSGITAAEIEKFLLRRADPQAVISAYGALLENGKDSGMIMDETNLPYPKTVILDALLTAYEESHDEQARALLRSSAMWLADYQTGVGDKPLGMSSRLKDIASMSPVEAIPIAAEALGPKFKAFMEVKLQDQYAIMSIFDRAISIPTRKSPTVLQRIATAFGR